MKKCVHILIIFLLGSFLVACDGSKESHLTVLESRLIPVTSKNAKELISTLQPNENQLEVWTNPEECFYKGLHQDKNWYSAYTQSSNIDILLDSYIESGDEILLKKAQDAAEVFFVDLKSGGVQFRDEESDYIWFEEFWGDDYTPTHALGAHLKAINTLYSLYEITNDAKYKKQIELAEEAVKKRGDLYDTGTGILYDLRTDTKKVTFSFANEYTGEVSELPVASIESFNPLNRTIDQYVEYLEDGWSKPEMEDGKNVRRLNPTGKNNFRINFKSYLNIENKSDIIELHIRYKDGIKDNLSLRIKESGCDYELPESSLLLTGEDIWRDWVIPVYIGEFGTKMDGEELLQNTYVIKKTDICTDNDLENRLRTYKNLISNDDNEYTKVTINPKELPAQSPLASIFAIDDSGVVLQFASDETTVFDSEGHFTFDGGVGDAIYSPYIIAYQALYGNKFTAPEYLWDDDDLKKLSIYNQYNWLTKESLKHISKEPALNWLKNSRRLIKDAWTWVYDFDNAYNDVVQKKGWSSAFAQKYVIDAFISDSDEESTRKATNAYKYPTKDGGLAYYLDDGGVWFEEVPNNTHILNADIASLISIYRVNEKYPDENYETLFNNGLNTLKDKLSLYDSGYWSKYDLNPKKEILFQLDVIEGEESPLIDYIYFADIVTQKATMIDIGTDKDFDEYPYISGNEWSVNQIVDGKSVRNFINGYEIHQEPIQGGTRQNSYFLACLPDLSDDLFNLSDYKIIISYKDTVKGRFALKVQSINEGSFLQFVPLKNAIIDCKGDGEWKSAEITIRPQDLGWYMGEDYQKYHIEMLDELNSYVRDWELKQYSEKYKYYLEVYENSEEPIVYPSYLTADEKKIDLEVIDSTEAYVGYGFENALDGDANDDYVACLENKDDYYFTVKAKDPISECDMEIIWESDNNYAADYNVQISSDGINWIDYCTIDNSKDDFQRFKINSNIEFEYIKIVVNRFVGQNRILLREILAF